MAACGAEAHNGDAHAGQRGLSLNAQEGLVARQLLGQQLRALRLEVGLALVPVDEGQVLPQQGLDVLLLLLRVLVGCRRLELSLPPPPVKVDRGSERERGGDGPGGASRHAGRRGKERDK